MIDAEVLQRLVDICGRENVSVDPTDLDRYSCDALTPHRVFHKADILNAIAWAVVKPGSSDEVSHVMRLACDYKVPVVPLGGGTGVMGAAIPVQGGIILDLKRMNRIISINAKDYDRCSRVRGDTCGCFRGAGTLWPDAGTRPLERPHRHSGRRPFPPMEWDTLPRPTAPWDNRWRRLRLCSPTGELC